MPAAAYEDSVVARLEVSEARARRILDLAAGTFDPLQVVVSMEERPGGRWGVALHFQDPPHTAAVRALVALAAGADAGNEVVFEKVAAQDWVKTSLAGLAPVEAGRFMVHGAHDRARVPVNRIGIEIEAALAFGTGHHGTTRGCLLALDRIARSKRPRRILDVGTGSGVLAIAAGRALRRPVLASDIDPQAARVARANARLNRVGTQVKIVHAIGVGARHFRVHGPFDLIFANILLGPLLRLAAPLRKLAARSSHVVLSGLLPSQANAILAAYRAQGLALEWRMTLEGWVTLVLRRAP
jgi:ribosomal protein L11 methyltransferase